MMQAEDKNIKKTENKISIEKLCDTTWESLYRFVYYKVQNREEAEDITQETYIKAISYINKNSVQIDKIMGFLRTVSLNVLRDKWRKGKRHEQPINFEDIDPMDAAVEDPTEIMVQREIIENAIKMLNDEQRQVIDLRILKGYSVADTATKMGKLEGNIRILQYRALQKLAKLLKNEY